VTAADLFLGPFETSLEPDELVVAARFPRLAPGTGWAIDELARRHGDYALAGVALTVAVDGRGRPSGGRAAYLSCAPTPVVLDLGPALASSAGPADDGSGAPADRALEQAAYDLVSAALTPTGDIHASADYRRHLAATLTVRGLGPALSRAQAAADARGATGEASH
jgi:carbon-monoxide dehydrogenase medium subunit